MQNIIPGVQHDRRRRDQGHDPERRDRSRISPVRYVTPTQHYAAFREQVNADFGFGQIDVGIDGRILFADTNAQRILNVSWFSGSQESTYLRQVVPEKYARMHDAEIPGNVLHKWVESDEIVRSLGKSNKMKIEDPESGSTKVVLISLTRPTRPDAVATATLIEERSIAGVAAADDIHWSSGMSRLIEKMNSNPVAMIAICITVVLVAAFLALGMNGYFLSAKQAEREEAMARYEIERSQNWRPSAIELHKPPHRLDAPDDSPGTRDEAATNDPDDGAIVTKKTGELNG